MKTVNRFIREYYFLIFIFVFVLAFRLSFVFESDNFSSDDAYFHFKHINSIVSENKILFYDDLSYGGRFVLYPPLFHILLALLTFGNLYLLKILPAIFASSMVFVAYLISRHITNDTKAALFSSLLASFVPLFITETLNNLSPYSLLIPILFLMIYFLSKIEEEIYLWCFIIFSILLPFLHSTAILFLLTIFVYFIVSKSESIKISRLKKEAILLSIFVIILVEFIIFKKAFLQYGLGIIWQNIPVNIFADQFKNLNIFDVIFGAGLLQLVLGLLGLYYGLYKLKNKLIYLLSSLILVIFTLLIFRLIPLIIGLIFLGISLAIISSIGIKIIFDYFSQTRFYKYRNYLNYTIFFVILFLTILPAYNISNRVGAVFDQTISDMEWINGNVDRDVVVLAPLQEGNLVTSIAKRKNVADNNFLMAPNPLKRSEDINKAYTTNSEAIALDILHKYDIDIIYISDNTGKIYGKTDLEYLKNKNCFNEIKWRIYEIKC